MPRRIVKWIVIIAGLCFMAGCHDESDPESLENTPELCTDTIDNDKNGMADCDDDVCRTLAECADTLGLENSSKACHDHVV